MAMRSTVFLRICLIAGLLSLLFACERDFSFRGDNRGLNFSTDTVMFDTVFTTIGSATHIIKVYNPYDDDLVIDAIELAGGDESCFRVNINGTSTTQLQDVRLRNKDSLFIFVEVTIDPAGVDAPFVVNDSVVFYTRECTQSVKLQAYGQDVILLKKARLQSQTLQKGKPYLIYDYAIIDSLQKVTIDAGARLYFHKDASMVVLGSLVTNGTTEEPVIFEGDRLEDFYKDKPGQWGFLQLLPGSTDNKLQNTIIRNGIIGVHADSIGNGADAPLIIENCKFEHISSIGLLAEQSTIIASNTLFADCGVHSVALTMGGSYEFYHCTIANYFNNFWGNRYNPALLLNNYYIDDKNKINILPLRKALFANCIVYGNKSPEVGFDFKTSTDNAVDDEINYLFDHALLKIGSDVNTNDTIHYKSVIINKDPSFVDVEKYNYRLDTLSAAKDAGSEIYGKLYPNDISDISRLDDKAPDLGIFERVEE